MTRTILLPIAMLALYGCGSFEPAGDVNGTIDGVVVLTAPVGGVVVAAHAYDVATGALGAEVAHSDPTGPDGQFHLDLGIAFGPMMLIARGSGATFTEPSTAAQVSWDAAQSLRAPIVAWSDSGTARFVFDRGAKVAGVVIGPWSELAYVLASARQARDLDDAFSTSLEKVLLLLRAHLEVDLWSTTPVDLTSGDDRTWQAPVQAGLEAAGFSQLVARMATASGTGGLSSVDLLHVLSRDAADGLFDGRGVDGSLTLGTCKDVCRISSQTLRSNFADSMALFLAGDGNRSTIGAAAVNDFLVRVATRRSELFPDDGMDSYDVTPPTIAVVASSVVDETMGSTTVPLVAGVTAVFGRYSDDYGPDSAGIPRWRFAVADDRTADADIAMSARLVRTDDMAELAPWFAVPPISGSGYNREVVVSSALASSIATVSGTYQLELRASDEKGNVSPTTTVSWQQTILPPPKPAVVIVDNTAIDEAPLVASATDAGPVFSGTPGLVTLGSGGTASFARYASHYGLSDSGIPKWHFLATGRAQPITVRARLVRSTDSAVLVPWFGVPSVAGSGYDREVVVSSALHPDVATLSGGYQLELDATDGTGTTSTVTVAAWQQTILTPPIRQRSAPACDPGSDGQCPAHYSLQGNLDAAVLINGIGLPGGSVRIGHVYVDNPNSVAVRVSIAPTASLSWSRGRKNWSALINQEPYTAGCQPAQTLDGTCYPYQGQGVEDVVIGQGAKSIATRVQVLMGGADPGPCTGCGTNERELPPATTADVWVVMNSYGFIWPDYPLGKLTNPNLPATAIGGAAETWISWSGTIPLFFQAWWYLTRVAVTPTVRTTLQSRPADPRASLAAAIGTNTTSFANTPSPWNTWAPGQSSF
jgi:hypothetical protein